MLEIEHDNLDVEIHIRHAKGNVLKFSISEFTIVTGLNCKGNVKDFTYPNSKTSRLVEKYFPDTTYNVNKQRLVDRFTVGQWENIENALQMAILYFIHTFLYSQPDNTQISN